MRVLKLLARSGALCLAAAVHCSAVVLAAEPASVAARDGPALPSPPEIDALIGLPSTYTEARRTYLPILTREAERHGLPPAIADAVAFVESGFKSGAVGGVGEVGLMQIRPETAAMLGYKGGLTGLFDPDTNIRFGVMYLARAWELADGDLCRALMKYRAGHGETRMTPLSIEYCGRARLRLAELGSPLANGAEPPSRPEARTSVKQAQAPAEGPGPERAGGSRRRVATTATATFRREVRLAQTQVRTPGAKRTAEDSNRFWAAQEARIREITGRRTTSRSVAAAF